MTESANIELMNSEEIIAYAKNNWNNISEIAKTSVLELEKVIQEKQNMLKSK